MRPLSLQRLFTRWAGLSPKAFVQALTLDHARSLLDDSASVLDATYEVGLSGPGRLHDLFVTHEAMTPGDYKARGAGLVLRFAFHPSPFGQSLIMVTDRGLAGVAFADPGSERTALADMQARWPQAHYVEDAAATAPYVRRIFDPETWRPDRPLRIVMIGSDFELRVWETLLKRAARQGDHLFRHRRPSRQAEGGAGGRLGGRQEPDLLRRALPPRARQGRRLLRLPLGPHPQARHPRLGGGGDREGGLRAARCGRSASERASTRLRTRAARSTLSRISIGVGGQPRMWRSTGTTSPTPPTTA